MTPWKISGSDGSAVSRRHVLQKMASGVVLGMAAHLGSELVYPPVSCAQNGLTPDEAMQELRAGNQRTVANQLTSIRHDLAILREHTVDKQEPFAGILACADSRVPVELVFDQTIGRLFVTRGGWEYGHPRGHGRARIWRGRPRDQSATRAGS